MCLDSWFARWKLGSSVPRCGKETLEGVRGHQAIAFPLWQEKTVSTTRAWLRMLHALQLVWHTLETSCSTCFILYVFKCWDSKCLWYSDVKKCPKWTPTTCGYPPKQYAPFAMHGCDAFSVPASGSPTTISCQATKSISGSFSCYILQVGFRPGLQIHAQAKPIRKPILKLLILKVRSQVANNALW